MKNRLIHNSLVITCIFFIVGNSSAQNEFLKASDSDQDATALLEQVNKHILSLDSYKMDFTMTYTKPQDEPQILDGVFMQKGKKYYLDLGNQLTISDGIYSWLYFKDRNEVQINDIDQDVGVSMTPAYFLNIHKSGDYVYTIIGERNQKSKNPIYRIDFKPLDKHAAFSKIGLEINGGKKIPNKLMIFNKDGSRIAYDDIVISSKNELKNNIFTFDMTKYKDIYIEDLRLE